MSIMENKVAAGRVQNGKNAEEPGACISCRKRQWDEVLSQTKIIAAVRSPSTLASALASPIKIVYLLFGNPMTIAEMIKSAEDCGKLTLVNADLLQGFSRDAFAVEYLAHCGVAGIISTNHETLRAARAQGLLTVLRTFMIDSASVDSGRRFLAHFQPDAVELLPAIAAPLVIERIREDYPELHVIAGGLVTNLKLVEALIEAKIDAVSASDPQLWVV
jgi:glycerol uptake operon antiterminator